MAHLRPQEALHQVFRSIADGNDPARYMKTLHLALRTTADDMRLAGRPIERVVAQVKSTAKSAGIRQSHDRIITAAVLWAIAYYYGEDHIEQMAPPAQDHVRRSRETIAPFAFGNDALAPAEEQSHRERQASNPPLELRASTRSI
jgi:hypothetical protein